MGGVAGAGVVAFLEVAGAEGEVGDANLQMITTQWTVFRYTMDRIPLHNVPYAIL